MADATVGGCSQSPSAPSADASSDTGAEKAQIVQKITNCGAAQQNFMNAQLQRESANLDYTPQPYVPEPDCTAEALTQLATRAWQLDIADARARGDTRDACVIEPMPGCDPTPEHSGAPE